MEGLLEGWWLGLSFAALATCLVFYRKTFADSSRSSDRQKEISRAIKDADERLRWSTIRLAEALRQNEVDSVTITKLYIEQIRKTNPYLNAVVGTRFDDALEEAAAADRQLAEARQKSKDERSDSPLSDLPPLLGVPMISKEAFEFPGLPYTCGIYGRRSKLGKRMNPVLFRCQEAGAIVLGNANTSEGCMWSESNNCVHGRSRNPYDLLRSPGGSSGGSASILSALGGSFAVTSDVGGSTRIPALYNGLFGHKASGGAVPNLRTVPTTHGITERYCQLGPSVRSAKDLMPILRIVAGPINPSRELADTDQEESELVAVQSKFARTFKWPDPSSVDLKSIRFFVMLDQPGTGFGLVSQRHPDMLEAQLRAVSALESSLGVKVQKVSFQSMTKCFDIWESMLGEANVVPFKDVISEGKEPISPLWEVFKWILSWGRLSDHTLPALGLAVFEGLSSMRKSRNAEMIRLGENLRDEINALLGENGVIICPGSPNPAPFHGPLPNLLYFADFAAFGIYNVLELPATQIPMGLSHKEGIPVGVQVVAANGNDHLTIACAMKLEDLGEAGWVPPRC